MEAITLNDLKHALSQIPEEYGECKVECNGELVVDVSTTTGVYQLRSRRVIIETAPVSYA